MTADPDLRAIGEALNRIDQYASLGRVSLAQARSVTAELARLQLHDTPFQRGRTLSRLIRDQVQDQFDRRKQEITGRDVAEWTILYLRLHDGVSLQQIADRLQMPLRSVARYYARAKELLLDRLYALDERQMAHGLYCPLCGTYAGDARPTSGVCRGCRAELAVEWDGAPVVHVSARGDRRHDHAALQ